MTTPGYAAAAATLERLADAVEEEAAARDLSPAEVAAQAGVPVASVLALHDGRDVALRTAAALLRWLDTPPAPTAEPDRAGRRRPWEVDLWERTSHPGRSYIARVGTYGTEAAADAAAVRALLSLRTEGGWTMSATTEARVRDTSDLTAPATWFGWPADATRDTATTTDPVRLERTAHHP